MRSGQRGKVRRAGKALQMLGSDKLKALPRCGGADEGGRASAGAIRPLGTSETLRLHKMLTSGERRRAPEAKALRDAAMAARMKEDGQTSGTLPGISRRRGARSGRSVAPEEPRDDLFAQGISSPMWTLMKRLLNCVFCSTPRRNMCRRRGFPCT